MDDPLQKITEILAFFEIWQYPLTKEEIEQFLGQKISEEILQKKFSSVDNKFFSTHQNKEILKKRRNEGEKYVLMIEKKAKKFVKILRHFPFLRAIALCNSGAMECPSSDSDIDFFLITKNDRIWTARFWSTIFFHLLGLRAKKSDTAGKFCLSFFVDESFWDFQQIQKSDDIYLPFWILTLRPYFGKKYIEKIWERNELWIREKNGLVFQKNKFKTFAKFHQSWIQKIWEFFLPDIFESLFRKLLLLKARKFRNQNSPQYAPDMIFTDTMQKLHNPDMREEIQRKWKVNLKNVKWRM